MKWSNRFVEGGKHMLSERKMEAVIDMIESKNINPIINRGTKDYLHKLINPWMKIIPYILMRGGSSKRSFISKAEDLPADPEKLTEILLLLAIEGTLHGDSRQINQSQALIHYQ